MSSSIKVLAFTASAKRPIYLRHCMMQLQFQTYPIDHAIYINSNIFSGPDDHHNYMDLIRDISISKGNEVYVGYGPSASHHRNHMAAVNLVNWSDYDLFFKIDDDDIYRRTYIEDAVHDYIERQWDFSGEISKGHIHGDQWKKNHTLRQCIAKTDHENGRFMPPTFAWNTKCMQLIHAIDDISGAEDSEWKEQLLTNPQITTMVRPTENFVYNIHQNNKLYRKPGTTTQS